MATWTRRNGFVNFHYMEHLKAVHQVHVHGMFYSKWSHYRIQSSTTVGSLLHFHSFSSKQCISRNAMKWFESSTLIYQRIHVFGVHKGTNKLRGDPAMVHTCVGGYIFCQKINTVDGSEIRQAPVEVDSLSHYLPRVLYIPGGDRRISKASMFFNVTYVMCVTSIARWWFQIYLFDVHPENWGRWTHFDYYFFRWVETTNQIVFHVFNYTCCTQIHQHLCFFAAHQHGCFPKGLGLQRVWVDSVALDALKSWEFSRKLGGLVGWIQSYSQLMIGMSFITETKCICFLGSMKPFSEDEPGSLGMLKSNRKTLNYEVDVSISMLCLCYKVVGVDYLWLKQL